MGEDLKALLQQRWGEDWLIGPDSQQFWQHLSQFYEELSTDPGQQSLLLIVEAEPLKFLARFCAACSLGHTLILGNSHWGKYEWQQVQPMVESGDCQNFWQSLHNSKFPEAISKQPKILIPTGGSSGQLKFVVHTWQTLAASVQGFQCHFQVSQVNAYCVLPLFHVSGLMQGLRVLLTGGTLALQAYRDLKRGQILPLPSSAFLSLVPTQLQGLLQQANRFVPWLKQFQAVLLGGAPAWPSLLQQAKDLEIPLALTYGMTETASQVATLLPQQFLSGTTSSGRPLPHAQIYILNNENQPLSPGQTGQVAIEAQSLAWGYIYPAPTVKMVPLGFRFMQNTLTSEDLLRRRFLTDDLGFLSLEGELHIVGRSSSKLISGGENVFPEEVEAVLLAIHGVQDVCVVGLPDRQWGQRICAVVVLAAPGPTLTVLPFQVLPQLALYKHPKIWIAVRSLPRTAQGKVNRHQILELVQMVLGPFEPYSEL